MKVCFVHWHRNSIFFEVLACSLEAESVDVRELQSSLFKAMQFQACRSLKDIESINTPN
jgi:hypothetical protein